MSKLRSISTALWSDPFIEDLTVSEKLLFIYLITNSSNNMLGIYEISTRKICFETGIDKATVVKALERFESVGKVKRVCNYIVLVNFMKHQNYNPNMKKSAVNAYLSLPQDVKIEGIKIDESNPLKAFESLSNGLGMVRKIEVEIEVEIEKEKEGERSGKARVPPFSDFSDYANEKAKEIGVTIDHTKLKLKYEAWLEGGWKTGKGNVIKNWKTTLLNTMPYLKKEEGNNSDRDSYENSEMYRLSKI